MQYLTSVHQFLVTVCVDFESLVIYWLFDETGMLSGQFEVFIKQIYRANINNLCTKKVFLLLVLSAHELFLASGSGRPKVKVKFIRTITRSMPCKCELYTQ